MSTAANLMNAFRGVFTGPGGQQPAATQTQPASVTANNTVPGTHTPGNDGTPGPSAIPPAGEGTKSPMEKYDKLWDKEGIKEPISAVPKFTNDPAKLNEIAKGIDFAKAVDPELIKKATSGGEGSTEAFMAAMNQVAQAGFVQSAGTTSHLVEQAITQTVARFENDIIPAILHKHNVTNAVTEHPMFTKPGAKPLLDGLTNQFVAKYPGATPAEIKAQVNEYLNTFMGEFASSNGQEVREIPKPSALASKGVQDWEKWGAQ